MWFNRKRKARVNSNTYFVLTGVPEEEESSSEMAFLEISESINYVTACLAKAIVRTMGATAAISIAWYHQYQ